MFLVLFVNTDRPPTNSHGTNKTTRGRCIWKELEPIVYQYFGTSQPAIRACLAIG